jgi:integrase
MCCKLAQMKRSLVSVKKWNSHPRYSFVCHFRQGGKRRTRYFVHRKDAQAFAGEKEVELLNEGRKHGELSGEERRAVIEAREIASAMKIDGFEDFSLRAAIEHYVRHLRTLRTSKTVERAYEEFLEVREAEGKSPVHLSDLRYRVNRFVRDFRGRIIASITPQETSAWVLGLKCGTQTRVNYRRAVHNFFSFCVGRNYAPSNPLSGVARIKVTRGEAGILSVSEATRLLAACPEEILPAVATGLFGGLRATEIARLDWHEIDLDRGHIEVKAAKTKSAQRRLVTVSENLARWLAPYRKLAGPVRIPSITYRRKFAAALRTAKIEHWPHNALRHSFASFHLAFHRDAAKTALELGHAESVTLFRHYRELVRPDEASAFWQIFPPKESGMEAKVLKLETAA